MVMVVVVVDFFLSGITIFRKTVMVVVVFLSGTPPKTFLWTFFGFRGVREAQKNFFVDIFWISRRPGSPKKTFLGLRKCPRTVWVAARSLDGTVGASAALGGRGVGHPAALLAPHLVSPLGEGDDGDGGGGGGFFPFWDHNF